AHAEARAAALNSSAVYVGVSGGGALVGIVLERPGAGVGGAAQALFWQARRLSRVREREARVRDGEAGADPGVTVPKRGQSQAAGSAASWRTRSGRLPVATCSRVTSSRMLRSVARSAIHTCWS